MLVLKSLSMNNALKFFDGRNLLSVTLLFALAVDAIVRAYTIPYMGSNFKVRKKLEEIKYKPK